MKMNGYYKTTDLYLASYLSLCGLQFVFTREDGIIIFLFEDKERAEKLVVDYLNDKATVSPKRFVETLQSLKSLIFGHI